MSDMSLKEKMDIIRKHQSEAPVKVVPIAKDLGLNVYYSSDMPNSISGLIKRDLEAKSNYSIYVNKQHPSSRRRFTLAHECAHFILHKDKIGDGITDDALFRSNQSNRVEAQANSLAADILMPWSLIEPLLNECQMDIGKLAERFNVSKSAMSIRLGVPYED